MYFLSYRNIRFSHLVFHTFLKKYCVRRCLNSRGVDREKNFIVMYSMIVIFWSVISGNILPIWTVVSYYEHYFKTYSRNFRRLALSYLCLGRRLIRSFKLALPSGQSSGHLIFWRLFCSNSFHLGQKLYSNAPPNFFFWAIRLRKWTIYLEHLHIKKYKTCIPRKDLSLPVQISSHRFKYPHTSQARLKFPTTGHGRWSMSVGCQGDVGASNWSAHKSLQSSQL